MWTSTTVWTLMVTLSVLALSACGDSDDAKPVGTDTSSVDASADGTAVQGDTDGADGADGAELPGIDDAAWASDAAIDVTEEVTAGDSVAVDVPDHMEWSRARAVVAKGPRSLPSRCARNPVRPRRSP